MKTNTLTWLALLLLTAVSFALSEHAAPSAATGFILLAAGLKCAVLGWQFLELRSAHALWRGAFLLVVTATLGTVALVAQRT